MATRRGSQGASQFLRAGLPLLVLVVVGQLGLTKIVQGRFDAREARQKAMALSGGRRSNASEEDLEEELQQTLKKVQQEMNSYGYRKVDQDED